MSLKKVLIVNKSYPVVGFGVLLSGSKQNILQYLDYEPESLPEIKKNIEGCDALIWNTKHQLTPEILDLAGPQLKAVSSMSSGLDHIRVEELKKRGIALGNCPHVLDNAVADIAVGLLIGAARKFKAGIRELESGQWKYGVQWSTGLDIAGSTVGIIGLGGIGQAIVRRLKGFDVARFLYSGRSDKPQGLIDQNALYDALKGNHIFAAGLDVVTPEPLPKDHPLISLPNCFILPHLGSATIETRNAMASIAANNILLALEGKSMLFPAY
ncbi:unnamed protein product [Diatraea saccharalis]|uniref:Uncharacterized protein n=1 Tax=Diatraea saccharalis TaxID=40085 RepID=A0A9P0G1T4_9NEOP|nr:unnamed protein product [Diatraea saccharalis]